MKQLYKAAEKKADLRGHSLEEVKERCSGHKHRQEGGKGIRDFKLLVALEGEK